LVQRPPLETLRALPELTPPLVPPARLELQLPQPPLEQAQGQASTAEVSRQPQS
jgi:hypothetical protein